jgi:hypothetical protein
MSETMEGGMVRRKRVLRKIAVILFVILVVIAGFVAFSWSSGRKAVKEYCADLKPGTDIRAAKALARSRGLFFGVSRSPSGEGGMPYIALVTNNWGPLGKECIIEHDSSKVIRARLDDCGTRASAHSPGPE